MLMTSSLEIIGDGLAAGSVYATLPLTVHFSILSTINLAYRALFALGAYIAHAFLGGCFAFNSILANWQ